MRSVREKAERFRDLHHRPEPFLLPNPWDIGSARLLAGLGFEALATTSSGLAQACGRADGELRLEEKLEHCRALCAATDVPVSADLENGFGDLPQEVAHTVRQAAETGLAGGSIEDFTGKPDRPIYDRALAIERVAAAAEAAAELERPFVLTARCENLLHGVDGARGFDDLLNRLGAYQEAGAEVLYAPGLRTLDQVRTVADAVQRPLNVLAPMIPGATLAMLAEAGAQRISIGGALARAMAGLTLRAGREMLQQGSFSWLTECAASSEVDELLARGASGPRATHS